MSLLRDLINTVGLDSSFFYLFLLTAGLYFISKNLFFQPYLEKLAERQKRTKGRLKSSKELESQIEEKKIIYQQKAQKIHKEFQETFNQIKHKTQENYLSENLKLKKEQKKELEKERQNLNQALKEQEAALEKDFPLLLKLLVDKIKS